MIKKILIEKAKQNLIKNTKNVNSSDITKGFWILLLWSQDKG